MAKYIGPKSKIARRFGEPIFGADKVLSKRNFPPGQHGNSRRRKQSEYAVMLAEKQKAKYTYGVLERQFRNMFEKAAKAEGITGEVLLQNLESRLDNVVYRMGFGSTRAESRQLVSHGAILVNGRKVNIPSYSVKAGDVISVREKAQKQTRILEALDLAQQNGFPGWVSVEPKKFEGTFKNVPARDEVVPEINEALIIERYSR